jgi:hypothetical protein
MRVVTGNLKAMWTFTGSASKKADGCVGLCEKSDSSVSLSGNLTAAKI